MKAPPTPTKEFIIAMFSFMVKYRRLDTNDKITMVSFKFSRQPSKLKCGKRKQLTKRYISDKHEPIVILLSLTTQQVFQFLLNQWQ